MVRDKNGVVGCFDETFCVYEYKDYSHCDECPFHKDQGQPKQEGGEQID